MSSATLLCLLSWDWGEERGEGCVPLRRPRAGCRGIEAWCVDVGCGKPVLTIADRRREQWDTEGNDGCHPYNHLSSFVSPGSSQPPVPGGSQLDSTRATPVVIMAADGFENAYELLTSIQGFDSFSLGPDSTQDEIARAFQTQSLIWHPDKNPGDPQALRIYQRMNRAYNTLMNPSTRASHDRRLEGINGAPPDNEDLDDSIRPSNVTPGVPEKQPAPENLGTPPPSAKPFAYVDKEPGGQTPAAKAGLRRGDAILRIGEAAHLKDVQEQLQTNLYQPVPALVIDIKGRFMKKWVVPHSWDPWAPASLLGCQMSDQCPLDLQSQHPAVLAERGRNSAAYNDQFAEQDDDEESATGRAATRGPRKLPKPPCWARCMLALFSLLGLALGTCLLVYPALAFNVDNFWSLPFVGCMDGGRRLFDARVPAERLLSEVELELLPSPAAVAPESIQAPIARAFSPPLPSPPPSPSPSPSLLPPPPADVKSPSSSSLPTPQMPSPRQAASSSPEPGHRNPGIDGYSMDAMRDGLKAILGATATMMLISALGLTLACCRPSRFRGVLTAVYLCCGLPSLVLLIFVAVMSFRSGDKAGQLLSAYSDCVGRPLVLGTEDFIRTADLAASFCITYAIALVMGMLCACRAIGWHAVARSAVTWISIGSGLLGVVVFAAGILLQANSDLATIYFDATLIGFGVAVMLVSLIGICGSRKESPCLLRMYNFALLVLLIALLCGTLLVVFKDKLDEELLWKQLQDKVYHVKDTAAFRQDFDALVHTYQTLLLTLYGLLVLVTVLDLSLSYVLLNSINKHGRLYNEELEMQPLTVSGAKKKRGGKLSTKLVTRTKGRA